jgi:hypothetical protein
MGVQVCAGHTGNNVHFGENKVLHPKVFTLFQVSSVPSHSLHAHCEAEEHVKHILGMAGVPARPTISDDYFKLKRAAFLKCKTV